MPRSCSSATSRRAFCRRSARAAASCAAGRSAPRISPRALAQAGAEPDAAALALAGGSVGAAFRLATGGGLALYGPRSPRSSPRTPLDRRRAIALAESCAGRDAGHRYELTIELIRLALARLALHGAGAAVVPLGPDEASAIARLAPTPSARRALGGGRGKARRPRRPRPGRSP